MVKRAFIRAWWAILPLLIRLDVRYRLGRARRRQATGKASPFALAVGFAERCMIGEAAVAYRPGGTTPLVYGAVYRLLIAALVEGTGQEARQRYAPLLDVVRRAQDPADGLFKDLVVANCNDDSDDSWGWRHLTAHAVNALALFDESAAFPLRFCHRLYNSQAVELWLEIAGLDPRPCRDIKQSHKSRCRTAVRERLRRLSRRRHGGECDVQVAR